jgi:hypothetical protein
VIGEGPQSLGYFRDLQRGAGESALGAPVVDQVPRHLVIIDTPSASGLSPRDVQRPHARSQGAGRAAAVRADSASALSCQVQRSLAVVRQLCGDQRMVHGNGSRVSRRALMLATAGPESAWTNAAGRSTGRAGASGNAE